MTWTRTALSALLSAMLLVFAAAPALAHDQLIESTPGYEAELGEYPTQIELEFNADIIDAAPAVLIRDSAGATVYQATPTVAARVATAPFPELDDGAYTLTWSVVSSDGHRIEGAIPFTLATGRTAASSSSESTTTASAVAPTMDETTAGTGETAGSASPVTISGPTGQFTLTGPFAVAAVVAGVGAVAALVALAIRRLRMHQ